MSRGEERGPAYPYYVASDGIRGCGHSHEDLQEAKRCAWALGLDVYYVAEGTGAVLFLARREDAE